jgi:thymidylate kinase
MDRKPDTRNRRENRRPLAVSFSGIDGAGKSTQIKHLLSCLTEQGLQVRVIRFWDDIARLTRIREGTGHKVFKGDKGIGSPEAPINRRDKNVRGWPMTYIRLFLYLVDAISLRNVFRSAIASDVDCVIFDRYIYDELANLNLQSSVIGAYVRLIMRLAPRPDISFILDADPLAARTRKPEYPLDFIRSNRQAYLSLSRMMGGFTIIAPMGIHAATNAVLRCAQSALAGYHERMRKHHALSGRDQNWTGGNLLSS